MEKKQSIYTQKVQEKDVREDFEYFRLILEATHPGLYQYVSVKEMQHLFDSTAKTLDSDMSVFGLYNKMVSITNQIRCGHTSLFFFRHHYRFVGQYRWFFSGAVGFC